MGQLHDKVYKAWSSVKQTKKTLLIFGLSGQDLDAAGILPYEAVVCSNLNNGERFLTYAVTGTRGGGDIILNGPTARKGARGDQIIIFCYEYYTEEEIKWHTPRIIQADAKNRIASHA